MIHDINFEGPEVEIDQFDDFDLGNPEDMGDMLAQMDFFEEMVDDDAVLPERAAHRTNPARFEDEALEEEVLDTLQRCVAGLHGQPGVDVSTFIRTVHEYRHPLDKLARTARNTALRTLEIVGVAVSETPDVEFDLFDNASLNLTRVSEKYARVFRTIREKQKAGEGAGNAPAAWLQLEGHLRTQDSIVSLENVLALLKSEAPDEEKSAAFRDIVPPPSRGDVIGPDLSFVKSAGEWTEQYKIQDATTAKYRISSGFPALDKVFTRKDAKGNIAEALGAWGPGEFHAIAAATGHGKSALSRRIMTAAAEDLVNGWGHRNAKILMCFTEEDARIVLEAGSIAPGQAFHHLRDNVVLADVGASRKRLIYAVWSVVKQAALLAARTNRPITDCGLPEFILLDYIGGIVEAGENGDTTAIENTANLIMRGICGWRQHEMESYAGETFLQFAGIPWPKGMEFFKPAVLTFVQMKKMQNEFFRSTSDPADFALANPKPKKADGSDKWAWTPGEGDFRLATRDDVRGSGVLQNHLTSLIIGHRSRPQDNPFEVRDDGRRHLKDNRARLIFVKTRNGSDQPFIPMKFDSNLEGSRGQYFDPFAEKAIAGGYPRPPAYQREGDPFVPFRPAASPFLGISY